MIYDARIITKKFFGFGDQNEASSGLKILIENKVNFDNKKNLLIASVILVSGIGGLTLQVAGLQITGVAFSTLLGIILYQILPEKD